ncbi:Na+/H+ antiporter subunit G [Erythrobacter sp. QSSC1-22B]|uniref:Na+/H+ antiporter subunit G n=1 Tax=Erythrobacter sp. QSSC1-22B TaxID=1860125 RepID=UPI0008052968|nr:Na+/H+ antiporter subunit G [Erythrobacter sp. QSSC1-22B]OBX19224.1 Na+/H+ antiporter subunit G [Erythrobacter sp. QSSC1-22B]
MIQPGLLAEILTSLLIVIGAIFALVGSWGLVRLPTLMERLHGPTKATTLGLGGILLGSVAYFQLAQGVWSAQELLVSIFLFITAPISANMIAKVHLHGVRLKDADGIEGPAGLPPKSPGKGDWATYEAPHRDTPVATSEE